MRNSCKISGFADEIDQSLEKQIKLLNQLNINYVEFRSANGKGVADYSEEEAFEAATQLKKSGIGVSAIGSPIGKISITDSFEPHMERLRHIVRLAEIFNTKYIRMFSFFIPNGQEVYRYKDEVWRRMDEMVNYAAKTNCVLLHENEKDIYGDIAPRCLELMESFSSANFSCTFDFANFVQCKQDTLVAYDMLKPYISYIHVKDALLGTGDVVPAGSGDGHLREILTDLDKNGYAGILSLEPHLAQFEGLKNLERRAKERTLTDGEAAFTMAYEALIKLLKEI